MNRAGCCPERPRASRALLRREAAAKPVQPIATPAVSSTATLAQGVGNWSNSFLCIRAVIGYVVAVLVHPKLACGLFKEDDSPKLRRMHDRGAGETFMATSALPAPFC